MSGMSSMSADAVRGTSGRVLYLTQCARIAELAYSDWWCAHEKSAKIAIDYIGQWPLCGCIGHALERCLPARLVRGLHRNHSNAILLTQAETFAPKFREGGLV